MKYDVIVAKLNKTTEESNKVKNNQEKNDE